MGLGAEVSAEQFLPRCALENWLECLLWANCRREAWMGKPPPKPLLLGLNAWYLCSLDLPVNSLFLKFVVSVGFWVCFSSRASQDKVSPSNLRVNLQFPIGSVTAWLAGLKKIELSTICFTRSFCPLDTFSSFWPDKAYLSSGYEPIIQSWIEIYGHPFVPAHTRSLW